ncbi:MAG: S8 family serine peptidase, partial [bacterium]|nr:S8 family serine peptidase [bacterium]
MEKVCCTAKWKVFLVCILAAVLCCPAESISSRNAGSPSERLPEAQGKAAGLEPALFAQPRQAENPSIQIKLGSRHFDPLAGVPNSHVPGRVRAGSLRTIDAPQQAGYYVVQFDAPVELSWKAALCAEGAELFDYVPDFAFIIRLAADREPGVRALPHVRWLGEYQASFKMSRRVADPNYVDSHGENPAELHISLFPGEDVDSIKNMIADLGGTLGPEISTSWKTTLQVSIPAGRGCDLAAMSGIKWVESEPKWSLNNNVATDIMAVRVPRDTLGLYGQGQTVGVCDTGLDQGDADAGSLHDDFEDGYGVSRVIQIFDVAGDGDMSDENSGHGTHVAGSVLGNGINSGSDPLTDSFPDISFSGIAPKANLVLQAVEDNPSKNLYLPVDLYTLFAQADNASADLHTNSWGADVSSAYTASSADVDQYMWDHKDFLILFSAGNAGVDADSDGVIDLYSIGAPGTAKNCLTVGATENVRSSGGYDFQWGTGSWASEYPANPIFSDLISDDSDGMAAFSSRGPTLDGRYKPDIVAPGTNIISTRSSFIAGSGWGTYDAHYMYMGGTSMATPLVAGAAALLREYLVDYKGVSA